MSSFTEPLILEFLDAAPGNRRFKLVKPFQYEVKYKGSGEFINVPAGYLTDFASVPRIFWAILPPVGQYGKAAVIHDYLCDECKKYNYHYPSGVRSRKEADEIFLEGMRVLKVAEWKCLVMFFAVRLWGSIAEFRGKHCTAVTTSPSV